jgi:hypothetical protein
LSGENVFIIDDDPINRERLQRLFQKSGYSVSTATVDRAVPPLIAFDIIIINWPKSKRAIDYLMQPESPLVAPRLLLLGGPRSPEKLGLVPKQILSRTATNFELLYIVGQYLQGDLVSLREARLVRISSKFDVQKIEASGRNLPSSKTKSRSC